MNGWVWAATNPAQVGGWEKTVQLLDQFGPSPTSNSRVRADRVDRLAQHLDGLFEPVSASVQPAKIARELARAAREAGRACLRALAGARDRIRAAHQRGRSIRGSITADQVVLAVNAWAAQIKEIGAGLVVVASDVIATEAAPERLDEAGIRRGVCISDGRRLVNYYHATADGRMVFGKGGGTLAYDNRITADFDHPGRREHGIRSQLLRTYPALWDLPIAERWSGPIDYSLSGLPFFVRLREAPSVLVCAGFSGDGVGPSRLAGEVLAELAPSGGDRGTPGRRCARSRRAPLPPEPIRYVGGRLVRAAIARKERSEDLRPQAQPGRPLPRRARPHRLRLQGTESGAA